MNQIEYVEKSIKSIKSSSDIKLESSKEFKNTKKINNIEEFLPET